jgi:DNA-binding NtrC family response regulator
MPMRRVRELVSTIAPTRLPVLIEGPTGSGKELVAGLVHRESGRKGNLVAFNVCAIGESMFEDSLFGHVRGAYTGAIDESIGFLREADGGTAFFDEISGLPMPLQAKLLRAVETGVFRPIGARRDVTSDFRMVAATNERLSELVEAGRFRADLKHRISGVVVVVPPLGERLDDIPALAHYFAARAAGRSIEVESSAIDLLMDTAWPGNVRELKQVLDVAVAFARQSVDTQAIHTALAHRCSPSTGAADVQDRVERRELMATLRNAAWNVDRAAADLGIHRATIYRRMKRHGIEPPRVAPSRATSRQSDATGAIRTMM